MTELGPQVRRIAAELNREADAHRGPTITVTVTVGDPEPGHWCDTCLLPSALRFDLHGIHRGGVAHVGALTYCTECGTVQR